MPGQGGITTNPSTPRGPAPAPSPFVQGSLWDVALNGHPGDNQPPPGLPYFEQDRSRLGGLLQGQSPFASSQWGGLISQLQQRASGSGPSVAQMQYQQAMGQQAAQMAGAAHGGGGPGAFRQAAIMAGQQGQGLAQGSALARTQEMQAAQGSLQGALGTRDSINSSAYQNILAQQLALSSQSVNAHLGLQNAANQASAAQYQALGSGAATLGALVKNNQGAPSGPTTTSGPVGSGGGN